MRKIILVLLAQLLLTPAFAITQDEGVACAEKSPEQEQILDRIFKMQESWPTRWSTADENFMNMQFYTAEQAAKNCEQFGVELKKVEANMSARRDETKKRSR
jgi:hypothetical protein